MSRVATAPPPAIAAGRRIIHVDMDAFFAAVEQRDRPELRGQPVVVGGDPNGRGVVATCSYEARAYGIHSAMPAAAARRLCPHAVFLRPDFARYEAASARLRAIFGDVTPLVEPLSLDEAFLDVTDRCAAGHTATDLGRAIQQRICAELALSASVGVAPVKFVAKIASDLRKPGGFVVVRPREITAFLADLPVRRLWGVGPATEARLHAVGLETIGAVARADRAAVCAAVGAALGAFLHDLAHGRDERPVTPNREAQSHGAERTFPRDLVRLAEMEDVLHELAAEVAQSLAQDGRAGRTVTIKVRFPDFRTVTRRRTLAQPVEAAAAIAAEACRLLRRCEAGRKPVRLLGVSVGQLVGEDDPRQLELPLGDP